MKSDARLRSDLLHELDGEPLVDPATIAVQVHEGAVTLLGSVISHGERFQAARAALRVGGVRKLTMMLRVALPAPGRRSDAAIALAASKVLLWLASLRPDAVQVQVERGWIRLSGQVDWEYQREAATEAVRDLRGVRGVHNGLRIRPRVSPEAVRADIAAALRRQAAADDTLRIEVSVNGGEVTLSGAVLNRQERELARHSAWHTPGVRRVVDHLTLAG